MRWNSVLRTGLLACLALGAARLAMGQAPAPSHLPPTVPPAQAPPALPAPGQPPVAPPAPAPATGQPAAPAPAGAQPVAPVPPAPATPPATLAPPPAGGTAPAPAAPLSGVFEAVAGAAAEAAGLPTAADGSPSTADLAAGMNQLSRDALQEAMQTAALEQERNAAAAERAERARRRGLYAAAARQHFQYLELRVREEDTERSVLQLALIGNSLAGVRRNLGQGLVTDELNFALAALYDLETINRNQDAAVANAMTHLERARRALPAVQATTAPSSLEPRAEAAAAAAAATGQGLEATAQVSDPAALAAEVSDIVQLFEQRQKKTGRDRLQALVLELAEDDLELTLDLAETACRAVSESVNGRAWRRAARPLEQLGRLLQELQAAAGSPAAAPAGSPAPSSHAIPSEEMSHERSAGTGAGA